MRLWFLASEIGRVTYAYGGMCADSPVKAALLTWLPALVKEQKMDVDPTPGSKKEHSSPEPVPEVDIYFRLLILHHLLTSPETYAKASKLADDTVEKMQSLNRRSMDPISAKIWFAVERAYELGGHLADARP